MRSVNIITLGISGFPYLKTAPVNKCIYINKIFIDAGFNATVINSEALLQENGKENYLLNGSFEKINFASTIKDPIKSFSKIKKRFLKLVGKVNQIFFLKKINSENKIDVAVLLLTDGSFLELLYYRILSKLLNFKLIIIYHEYRSDFAYRRKRVITSINDKLFDNNFAKYVDAVFPISEFLIQQTKKINSKRPILKIPTLVDFSLFNKKNKAEEPYFLFCGSAGFSEIISFIIDSFDLIKDRSYFLYLVCSGNKAEMDILKSKISDSRKAESIKLYSDLEYEQLIELYLGAKGLLIPLKNDLRDLARFPQKVAEYAASGAPIISTNFGEMKYYFKDGVNAFLAEKFEAELYSEKMQNIINDPENAKQIGAAGKKIGSKHFDYKRYTESMEVFIKELLN